MHQKFCQPPGPLWITVNIKKIKTVLDCVNAFALSSGFLANCRSESRLHQRVRKAWMVLQSLIITVKFEHQGPIDCLKLQLFYMSSGLGMSWSRKGLHDGSWNLLAVLGLVAHMSISCPSPALLCHTGPLRGKESQTSLAGPLYGAILPPVSLPASFLPPWNSI